MTPKTSEAAKVLEGLLGWTLASSAEREAIKFAIRTLRESDGGGEVVPAEVWALVCSGGKWWERLERERTFRVGDFGNTAATATENCIRGIRIAIQKAAAPPAVVEERPPYPEGDVSGPCVCGSWPGGPCLRCKWIPAPPLADSSVAAIDEEARRFLADAYRVKFGNERAESVMTGPWNREEDAAIRAISAALRSASPSGMVLVNEAQLVAITEGLGEHPEDWDGPCMCADCRSYAAEDAR